MKCVTCPVDGPCFAESEGFTGLCGPASKRAEYAEIVRKLSAGELVPPPPVVMEGDPPTVVQSTESARLGAFATPQKTSVGCGCGCGGC